MILPTLELEEHELRKAGIVFISKQVETKETFQKEIKDFDPDIILSDYNLLSFDGLTALTIAKGKVSSRAFRISIRCYG